MTRERERVRVGGGFGNHFYAFADFFVDVEFPLSFCTHSSLWYLLVRWFGLLCAQSVVVVIENDRFLFIVSSLKELCNAHWETKCKSSS